jgi:hypothetical protein
MREAFRNRHLACAGNARTGIVVLPAVALLFALAARPAWADSPPVTFFHFGDADARWVQFTPAPAGDPDTWSIRLRINSSPATCPPPNYVNCSYAGVQLHSVAGPPPATSPAFDFYATVAGASGGSPRLHMDFSDGGSMELRPLAWVANTWTHEGDGATASDWDNNGGTCGFRYEVPYAVAVACHSTATVTGVIVVTDSSWLYPQYINYIDNIRYGNQLITSPPGGCNSGDGDGDFNDDKDGHSHHAHFHNDECQNESGDVEDDDSDSGRHFESNSVSSATYSSDADSQALTMVGTGVHDGLPVGFTMVAVDHGDLAPGVFMLILTDGYSVTGSLVNGGFVIQ